jgi:hypothetical protein
LAKEGLKYNTDGFLVEENDDNVSTAYTIENGNIVRKEVRIKPEKITF